MKFDFYVTKETGETLYCYNKLHKDQSETRYLISAMLSALNLYAKEGLGSEMNSVNLSNLLMTLVSNKELGINYYLITSNKEKKAKTKLEEFKKEFENKYAKKIPSWNHDLLEFGKFDNFLKDY